MAHMCIMFGGSGTDVQRPKFEFVAWEEAFRHGGYQCHKFSGVMGGFLGKNSKTGKGWGRIVQSAMDKAEPLLRGGVQNVVIIGHSRGGVQSVVFANCVHNLMEGRVNQIVIALDPVPGAHLANGHSFNMDPNRGGAIGRLYRNKTGGGSRDELREKWSLDTDAWKKLPQSVSRYASMVCQWHKNDRSMPGFLPQMVSNDLLEIPPRCTATQWELPADHADVVAGGEHPKPGDEKVQRGAQFSKMNHRQIRTIVVKDMIDEALRSQGLPTVFNLGLQWVLDAYSYIAIADLCGDQMGMERKKRGALHRLLRGEPASPHSFLREAHLQKLDTDTRRRYKAGSREQIVKTRAGIGRGFINQRHQQLFYQIGDVPSATTDWYIEVIIDRLGVFN